MADRRAQKDKYMPDIVAGKKIVAVGVTEPGAGSDVKAIRTTARRDGDHFVLNGAKTFITNGVYGDLYCIAARSDPGGKPSQSISMFLVEKDAPGFKVARALDKHGWRSSDTAELVFEDCRIPAENILGKEGRGFYSIMKNFQNERIVLGAMAMGEAQAAIELTLDWITQRKAFGTTLFEKQAIRQRLADAGVESRGRAAARLSCRLPGRAGDRRHARGLDGEGLLRGIGQRGHVCLRAIPRRHGLHARKRRSSGCRGTPACRPSAAGPPKSCWKKWRNGFVDEIKRPRKSGLPDLRASKS